MAKSRFSNHYPSAMPARPAPPANPPPLGADPVFSEFAVTNPVSQGRYRVAIRGAGLGENFCTCPDYATNDLGTCKHLEFALGRLEALRGGKAALKRGYRPHFSELFLDYAGQRRVRLRLGTDCPEELALKARALLDVETGMTPLENRLEELVSIVQFVDQHRLGPTWRPLNEHQQRDESGRVIGYQGLDCIGATLAPILLRRRKAEVLDQLPARVDNTLFVPLTEPQRLHHDENGDIVVRIVKRRRRSGYLSEADQRRLTCALQNMRMACNSNYLLDQETDHGHKADELMLLLEDLFEHPDAKVVVFSQWRRTHHLIIHRLGQSKSVQVVNFVAQGSIEEGRLAVLAFKKSLFAGVLDGGAGEVFMHGTRRSKFMESVEEVTRAAAATPAETDGADAAREEARVTVPGMVAAPLPPAEEAAEPPPAPVSPWAPLLEVGLQFLGSLANAAQPGQTQAPFLETDPQTGRAWLKLPVPEPAAIQRLTDSPRKLLATPRS